MSHTVILCDSGSEIRDRRFLYFSTCTVAAFLAVLQRETAELGYTSCMSKAFMSNVNIPPTVCIYLVYQFSFLFFKFKC